jgi:nucleoside-diphosphate-sugar epimerase
MFSWGAKHVVVTGGAGFIGSHLVERLVTMGTRVRVVDNLQRGRIENIGPVSDRVEFLQGSLEDASFADRAIRGTDVVFDFASRLGGIRFLSKNPASILSTNLRMLLYTLEAARIQNVERYFYASSSCVYGQETPVPHKEDHAGFCPPESAYGWSKIAGEALVKAYHEEYGLRTYLARPFNVYGPKESLGPFPHVIIQFIKDASKEKPLMIYGDGKQTRAFTYVSDVIDGIVRIAESPYICTPFNLGSGQETSINELADLIIELYPSKMELRKQYCMAISGDIRRRAADSRRAKELLDWEPTVELRVGLKNTIEWYRSPPNFSTI